MNRVMRLLIIPPPSLFFVFSPQSDQCQLISVLSKVQSVDERGLDAFHGQFPLDVRFRGKSDEVNVTSLTWILAGP